MREKNGWIIVDVVPEAIERAKAIRAERDQRYGNIFAEEETDLRWSGDLGEIYFDRWLRHEGILNYQWITDAPAGNADFIIRGVMVGVKTVKRKVEMRKNYTAQVTTKHVNEPVSHFFFLCYVYSREEMWLLGGITKEHFIANATYHGAGEYVHPNYQIRPGHEIYNIGVPYLNPPKQWLQSL
jgi:hypothetical protein